MRLLCTSYTPPCASPRLRKAIKPHTLKVPNNSGNRKETLRGSEIAELFGHGNDGKLGSAADCSLQDAGSEKLTSRRQFCLGRSSDGAFGRSVDRFRYLRYLAQKHKRTVVTASRIDGPMTLTRVETRCFGRAQEERIGAGTLTYLRL
jgi:hypothetical protein